MTKDKKLTFITVITAFWLAMIISLFIIKIGEHGLSITIAEKDRNSNHHEHMSGNSHHEHMSVIPEHEQLNEEPKAPEITRLGSDVYIKMQVQITEIEIKNGLTYKAWTFNGEVPGPLIVVQEGDTIHFTMETMIR